MYVSNTSCAKVSLCPAGRLFAFACKICNIAQHLQSFISVDPLFLDSLGGGGGGGEVRGCCFFLFVLFLFCFEQNLTNFSSQGQFGPTDLKPRWRCG